MAGGPETDKMAVVLTAPGTRRRIGKSMAVAAGRSQSRRELAVAQTWRKAVVDTPTLEKINN